MNKNICNFLIKYFNDNRVGKEQITKLLKTETATNFLLIWSIFESKCFNGFCRDDLIVKYNDVFTDKKIKKDFEKLVQVFHNRYQDKNKWKNLCYKNENKNVTDIKNKRYEDLTEEEKLIFGLYVVFRFRNNIFHDNKKLDSWLAYKEQINNCISMMLNIMIDKNITTDTQ
jgi:hypothetical protein